jgi:hypothetical protein
MWLSADPAMGEYIPQAPVNDDIRKQNQNLPGMGGVYNYVNLHAYHYAGNNPVKLTDPDGRDLSDIINAIKSFLNPPPVDKNKVINGLLGKMNLYFDPNAENTMYLQSSDPKRNSYSEIILKDVPAIIGVPMALPRGGLGPQDYDDQRGANQNSKIGKFVTGLQTLDLTGSTFANMYDGFGHSYGDIILEYKTSNGKITQFSIIETVPNVFGTGLKRDYFSAEEARNFLIINRERFDEKTYIKIKNVFNIE